MQAVPIRVTDRCQQSPSLLQTHAALRSHPRAQRMRVHHALQIEFGIVLDLAQRLHDRS
jgi:hypothetical protein